MFLLYCKVLCKIIIKMCFPYLTSGCKYKDIRRNLEKDVGKATLILTGAQIKYFGNNIHKSYFRESHTVTLIQHTFKVCFTSWLPSC